jgi:PadR family transcriptional regulator PadR
MAVAIHELTGFQRDLLYAIAAYEYPSGQTLREELEAYMGHEITHGQLYPNLDTLVDSGLVDKGQIDRRTNFYALSDEGEQSLKGRREWENGLVEFF